MTSVDPLRDLYVPVRSVGAPECPFDAVVARGPDGRGVLLVDRESLEGWAGWDVAGGEHLLTPLDVIRRSDGHDVVLPLLGERLDRLLARREHASTPLTDGERVTVAVSILRGLSSVVERSRAGEIAQWWLTDDGRPTLVLGCGDTSARRASADVLASLVPSAGSALDGLIEGLSVLAADDRAKSHELDAAEDALFSVSEAEPLATAVMATRRPSTGSAVEGGRLASTRSRPEPWWRSLAFHMDEGLAGTAWETRARMRHAVSRVRSRKRLPVFVGAGTAVTVLAVGLLWPASAQDEPGRRPAPTASVMADPGLPPSPSAAALPPPGGPATAEHTTSPDHALDALLKARRACVDHACRTSVLEDPATPLSAGAIDADPSVRTVTLVDDLGGLAVLRVATTDGSAAEQFVTVVTVNGEWRVRDAYNVAHPPS